MLDFPAIAIFAVVAVVVTVITVLSTYSLISTSVVGCKLRKSSCSILKQNGLLNVLHILIFDKLVEQTDKILVFQYLCILENYKTLVLILYVLSEILCLFPIFL